MEAVSELCLQRLKEAGKLKQGRDEEDVFKQLLSENLSWCLGITVKPAGYLRDWYKTEFAALFGEKAVDWQVSGTQLCKGQNYSSQFSLSSAIQQCKVHCSGDST